MTGERKQELIQLLQETMKGLQILYDGFLPIPIGVYRKYLQERWAFYGVDYLSFAFSTRFTLFIVGENNELKHFYKIDRNSKLLKFIVEELAPFIREDGIPSISTGSYIVESGFTDGSRLFCPRGGISQLHHILERLLHITLVRGKEEAVKAFDRSCCPEGVHGFFQYVAFVDGIKIETAIQIFEGVRLIPLPSLNATKTTDEVLQYLPGFPSRASFDQEDSFFGKTLLIIDQPGFSIFHKPPEQLFEPRSKVSDLPFQVDEHDVKFQNSKEINAFIKSFFQALSLVCNSSMYIYHLGWFLGVDKSLQGQGGTIRTRDPFWDRRPFVNSTKVEQTEIDKAKYYYEILSSPNSSISEKLQIPIGRWKKSKASANSVDKIIDLGIALESLYLSGTESKNEIRFRFSLHAAWHLGENKEHREGLMKKFKAIYDWRSAVVHTGKLPEKGKGKKKKSYTQSEVSEFIRNTQDLCRDSIIKILEEGKYPDWNDLILG